MHLLAEWTVFGYPKTACTSRLIGIQWQSSSAIKDVMLDSS